MKGPAAPQRTKTASSSQDRSFLTLTPFRADNWEVCVPVSLQLSQQLLQFIACKCGHMVISSLTFPCEYGCGEQKVRLHYDTKTAGYPTVELVLICLLSSTMNISLHQSVVRMVFEACRMQAHLLLFCFHAWCTTMHWSSFICTFCGGMPQPSFSNNERTCSAQT